MTDSAFPAVAAAARAAPDGILVAGMHRSGTSAVTRILSLLGAQLPDRLMPAHADYNAAGFWESTDVVEINDAILAQAESGWDDVLPVDLDSLEPAWRAAIEQRIDALLARQFGAAPSYVLKDPRLCRVLPLWLSALRRGGARAHVVITVRHPADVAASLARRDGFSLDKSLQLWLRHMLDAIRHGRDMPLGIVMYDDILQDWRASVDSLRRQLGLDWQQDPDSAAPLIERFIAPALRHHRQGASLPPGVLGQMAAELHAALVRRAPDLAALAQAMHQQLGVVQQAYAAMLRDSRRGQLQAERERQALQQALAARDRDFAVKCDHVVRLEAQLGDERSTYRRLEGEFDTKCRHIDLLQAETAKLRGIIDSQRQAGAGLPPAREQLAALQQENARLRREQRVCREDIGRAQAQLELLTTLWLEERPARSPDSTDRKDL